METIKQNIDLPHEEKMRRLKEAKGGTWYDGWRPYCMICNRNDRMVREPYGFRCPGCGNMIGFNLERLEESPLNNASKQVAIIYMSQYKRKITHKHLSIFNTSTLELINGQIADDEGFVLKSDLVKEALSNPVFDAEWKIL